MDNATLRAIVCTLAALVTLGCAAADHDAVRFPALYLDMDGTLLDSHHEPRPATLAALERYRRCGGQVGIATGRIFAQVQPHLAAIRPTLPLVLFNGAAVMSDSGALLLPARRLAEGVRERVRETCEALPGVLGLVAHDVVDTVVDRSSAALDAFLVLAAITPTHVDPTLVGDATEPPVKVMALVEPAAATAVRDTLADALGDTARVVVSSPRTVEVLGLGADKGSAIRAALATAHIDPMDVVTFGDSGNDVEMLSELAVGIAMDNCRPEACAAALLRTRSNDTDAIAELIERLLLRPSCPALDE